MNPHAAALGNQTEGINGGSGQQTYHHGTITRTSGAIARPVSDESWMEVSSRPSSSSLSSAATDEVVTTGLRVAQDSRRRQRRLHQTSGARRQLSGQTVADNEISQEEYDESDSDSDRVMTSSNEDLQTGFAGTGQFEGRPTISRSPHSHAASLESAEGDDDDDEIATALGVVDPTPFTPQPHAFSHPPSTRITQRSTPSQDLYFPPTSTSPSAASRQTRTNPSTISSPSVTSRAHVRTRSHTPYNIIAPNHTVSVDHDAALRASLSTLLSCAAAARGLPKRDSNLASTAASNRPGPLQRTRQSSRVEPGSLRIVPESALTKVVETPPTLPRRPSPHSTDSSGSPDPGPAKRRAKSPSRDKRKKQRSSMYTANDDLILGISPTLTTWVVGAGVLVLLSAISFSAGYALGKEVGRVDAMGTGAGLGCASEADGVITRGLGRSRGWRWGNASGVRA